MGESGYACVMQPFSYVSGIPNEANEGHPLHSLGHSISFGRFMTEPLDWDKWSTFSSKRYVEEAERYSKPGSVAQKKAFFEAHYKNIAARKAAALLEKVNATAKENVLEPECQSWITTLDSETMVSRSQMVYHETEEVNKPDRVEAFNYDVNGYNSNDTNLFTEQPILDEKIENTEFSTQNFEDKKMEETEPTNGTFQMEEHLNKIPKNQGQRSSSEKKNKRAKTPFNPLLSGSRKAREKWHIFTKDCSKILSACRNKARSPFSATPFCFTTEERIARRKMKLEEKFNAIGEKKEDIEAKVMDKTQKEDEKLHTNLCFKARPLSNFYRQRKAPKNQTNKDLRILVFKSLGFSQRR